jgi:hypothetical protein
MSDYLEFMKRELGANYVIARQTPRIVAKYGDDVACVTPKQHAAATRKWRLDHGREYDSARAEMYVALLAAEASLSIFAKKELDWQETRRKETYKMVRSAIAAEQATF